VNPEIEDHEILGLALAENAIIITMDKDFGELIYKESKSHKGVLLLRLDDALAEEKLAATQTLFPYFTDAIRNKFAVYQNGKLRIRD
jgi:predicted nuclease of predicted toxin-antitoxin system